MVNPVNWIKVKIFNSVISSLNEELIADMIVDFGRKQFGNECLKYVDGVTRKLIDVITTLNRRKI